MALEPPVDQATKEAANYGEEKIRGTMHFISAFLQLIHDHPALAIAFLAQLASAMPSPTETGFTSSWGYKWFFGVVHSPVAIARVVITLFPQYAAIFGVNAAQRDLQATDKKNLADANANVDPQGLGKS
jgi:hypothetical protein